jgi:glycosyltransferase involved in cell wall biosynthesis
VHGFYHRYVISEAERGVGNVISIVIPALNEGESLALLVSELDAVATSEAIELEIILVDDGSSDNTWEVIAQLAAQDHRVHGIRFRRNFGKAAALDAGFRVASGRFVITLDADLQDDPREIPRLLEKICEGFDVVSGWKKIRHDPWNKIIPSRIFNWLIRMTTGIKLHDVNCGMKCYRQEVLSEVHLYGGMHRFVPVLAAARGFRVNEIAVSHRPRQYGKTKYGSKRLLKGLLDLITVLFLTGYGHRPQHLLGGIGLVAFMFGGLGMVCLAIQWVLSRLFVEIPVFHVSETALLYFALGGLLVGGQMLSLGLIAEMLAAEASRGAVSYSVLERTEFPHSPTGSKSEELPAMGEGTGEA